MHKTATFKLHNVSKHKKSILLKAMHNSHLLTSALLDKAKADPEGFRAACAYTDKEGKEKFNSRNGYNFFKQCKSLRDAFQLTSILKAGAIYDACRMMTGYLESEVGTKQPPNLQRRKQDERAAAYEAALEDFITCGELQEENTLKSEIAKEPDAARYHPLLFRYVCSQVNPGVMLALHKPSNTYRAVIYVDNVDKTAKKEALTLTVEHQLFSVLDGSPVIGRSASTMLVPLEMGFYQVEHFLKKGKPREGKLTYRADKDEFYLHVAFEFAPEAVKPKTIMGVDRGIINICAYSVLTPDFKEVARGHCEGVTLLDYLKKEDEYKVARQQAGHAYKGNRKRNFADRVIHLATNEVVLKAQQYQSQVYVEDLESLTKTNAGKKQKGKRGSKGRLSSLGYTLSKAQYTKFLQVLSYKLQAVGLPPPKAVHAAWTSTTCPVCGTFDKGNRASRAEFKCIKCGHTANADLNAGRMIAMKGVWHWMPKPEKKKIKGEYKGDEYAGLWSNFITSVTK